MIGFVAWMLAVTAIVMLLSGNIVGFVIALVVSGLVGAFE